MINGWIDFWTDEDLPVNLRNDRILKGVDMMEINKDENFYTTPAILYLVRRGKDAKLPDYIYDKDAKHSVGDDGAIYSFTCTNKKS